MYWTYTESVQLIEDDLVITDYKFVKPWQMPHRFFKKKDFVKQLTN